MSTIYTSPMLTGALTTKEKAALVADFKAYVEGSAIHHFGRDVPYDHPHTPRKVLEHGVRHIHLFDPAKPWRQEAPPFQKTSDIHLVYCTGQLDESRYLLMAMLAPDGHTKALNRNVMAKLGTMAEKFRLRY
ncbi:type II toxin-antitoxin system YafO family toxin [Parahaliea maris]|uniref:Type II toxin-antitoxin system YafO family toxin n=1 Tax=Parahaliea maris TaxID=2716870 RepID=A0A5C9A7U6_9GAMM|nr:type II toxin-antitoxin system YafO family toxin [Parahaliea maris]TXS96189.1 type II toxin-antitoxin system YafO family toxin [Parahaliea maris]